MRKKRKAADTTASQPYDTSFKALLDDQTIAMLSFFFDEEVLFAQEVKESLFKRETVQPALRVDCAYAMQSCKHGQERIRTFLGHTEFETAPTFDIEDRLFEYYALLRRKHKRPIVQVLVCPFETSNLPTPPNQIALEDGEVQITHHYRVVALWKREATELLTKGWVELYALLPAMKGATLVLLSQALKAMKAFYARDETQLCMHLLWFDTLLDRTTTVSENDKERTREAMNEFESLLDSGHFVRQRVAKSRAEALAEGEAKGLQEALAITVELRFPALLELAQEKAEHVKQPDVLRFVLRAIKAAPSEEAARSLLDTLAA
jgi:hypothetical protein